MATLDWYTQYFSVFGVGIHVLIAVFFAIHAIRSGKPYFWLWILFVFPFLGSVVYFVAEYLPQSRMPYQTTILSQKFLQILQPNRSLNKAKEDYEQVPSVQHAIRYAQALTAVGRVKEAIAIFEQKLNSFCENDPFFLEKMAISLLQDQQAERVLEVTKKIQLLQPTYDPEGIALLRALSYHQLNHQELAQQEFKIAMRSKNILILSEYIYWAIQTNQPALAHQIRAEMQQSWIIWPKYSRQLHKPIFKKVDKELKLMDKRLKHA